jgi:large subunit ribosomal protein L30
MVYIAIRVRGHSKVNHDIEDCMQMMRLNRINHAVIMPENDYSKGMLQKSKDYITWGEVSPETVQQLIAARGRMLGDKPITDADVKSAGMANVAEFVAKVASGEFKYGDLNGVKPLFRLSPPKKGYGGNKRTYKVGGALGYRGSEINDLVLRML